MAVTDTQNSGSVVERSYSGPSGIDGSYSFSAAIDGYVWLHRSYSDQCYLINSSTGVGVALGGQSDSNAYRYFVGIGKNSAGDYIAIQTLPVNAVYWWNFGPSLATPTIKASGSFTQTLGNVYNPSSNNIIRTPGSNRFLALIPGGGTINTMFDLDAITAPTNFSLNVSPASASGKVLSATSSVANTDFGTVNIRATGIKTTA
jgi:hypothetical protein